MPRKKTRKQISIRIDQALMDLANRTIPKDKTMTALLERGILLALNELETQNPIYQKARIVLNQEGVVFNRRMLKIAALEEFPKVRELKPLERAWRDFMLAGIDSVEILEAGKASQ